MPIINTIRFDTDLGIIGKRAGVFSRLNCDGYCMTGITPDGKEVLGVGIRIRLNFYTDKIVDEVAGYLSETESTVLNHTTALQDLPTLNTFAEDVFRNIRNNLQRALPQLDLSYLEFSDPKEMGYHLSEGLIQLGLYNS